MLSPNTLNVQKQLRCVFVNDIYKYNTIIQGAGESYNNREEGNLLKK